MYNLRREDSGFCGEESHKTNNKFQFDLEDGGFDEILSQALDLFEEGSSCLEFEGSCQVDGDGRCISAVKNPIDRKGEKCPKFHLTVGKKH